jgi:PAS domain S-box-containing protein
MNTPQGHRDAIARDRPFKDGGNGTAGRGPDDESLSRTLFQLALRTARLGSWDHDLTTGEFICTGIFEELYHLNADQKRSYDDLFGYIHAQDRDWVRAAIDSAIDTHSDFEAEHRMTSPGGAVHWVLVRGRALYDDGGLPVRMVAVTLDVTEQRRAEQERRATEHVFKLFMGNLSGAAWMKDLDGRYVFANEEAVRIFRTPREQLYGRTDAEVFPAETARQFELNDRLAIERGTTVQTTETLEQDDGTHQSIVNKFLIVGADERPMFVGGIAIDVTDRLQAEQKLRENDRRKDEFLAMLAHELRNPLAAVKNALQLAEVPQLDEAERNWSHEIMHRQVSQLARLIDDLLDVSRFTRGKVQLKREQVDLDIVVDHAVQAVRSRIDELGHKLTVTRDARGPLWVVGDAARLEQVLVNLLTNAAKYTPREGRIWITSQRDEDRIVVRIKDSGMGISAEMMPHVFDLFAQADRSIDRAQGGLGIGLTLAKNLVELHGGRISAVSEGEGCGSEFIVQLPAAAEAPSQEAPSSQGAAPPVRRKVLVVDDNRDAARALSRLLMLAGHETRLAFDGTEALAVASGFLPEVILLDIGLPGMDGYCVARTLRESTELCGALLIAISGYGQPDDRRRSAAAGFDHHLVKPVDHDKLMKLLV